MKVSERFKLISISLLFIVGLISCSMQASAEAGGSGKIPNRIEGLYLTQLGNSLFYDIFYPDGSYVQLDYEKPLPEREAMLFSMIAGVYKQNGEKLDIRYTGSANSVKAISEGRANIDPRYDMLPVNTEITDLIRFSDGSFYSKRVRIIVNGKPSKKYLNNRWSTVKTPQTNDKQIEVANNIRHSIPERFFTAAQRPSENKVQAKSDAQQSPLEYVSQGGLTWMPVSFYKNWSEANSYCTNTAINGQNGWRLPTKDELSALYNSGAMKGQGWTLGNTWSSTPDGSGRHYDVGLHYGGVDSLPDTYDVYVTCVR